MLCNPLREGFLLPCGLGPVARATHRAQPSDPPLRATEQGCPAVWPLAVRMGPRQRYPTAGRPLGARTLRRDGSYRPRGGFHHHTRSRMKRSRGLATEQRGPVFNVSSRRVGVSNRQAGGAAISPQATGTRRVDCGRGIGDAVSCGHRGVPGPRRAVPPRAGSQPEESRRAASPPLLAGRDEQAPSGRAPAGQRKSRYAVTKK